MALFCSQCCNCLRCMCTLQFQQLFDKPSFLWHPSLTCSPDRHPWKICCLEKNCISIKDLFHQIKTNLDFQVNFCIQILLLSGNFLSPKSRSATRSGSVSRPRRIQDPYPHYNQCGSATLVLNIENNLKRILFPFNHLLKIVGTSRIFNLGHDTKYFWILMIIWHGRKWQLI